MTTPAHLILADGRVFSGQAFGSARQASGEVVFNTSMTGYQEILTDPSYHGQIVVMTYPQIGNYGINFEDVESRGLFLSGFIVKELSPLVSNYRSKMDLDSYLKKNKIPGIQGIDTRALVRHIREQGAMPALMVRGALTQAKLKAWKQKAKKLTGMEGQNLAEQVTTTKAYQWTKGLSKTKTKPRFKVLAYDFGIKQNILRLLVEAGCQVKVVPAGYPAKKVLKENPDGIFLSNGPGDPAACTEAIANVKELIGQKPIFGICLGHQILSLALGLKSFKLKFGHHGGNQPVMNLKTKKVEITAQNHGFAIDSTQLPKGVKVTHVNLNDQTVEGMAHDKWPLYSVQHHPEASPGPHDSQYLFSQFISLMEKHA